MPAVQRSLESNRFCVPAALSALTGLHVDRITELLKEEIGDQPIEGILYPLALKILNRLGFKYQEITARQRKEIKNGLFLVCFPGHVGVIEGLTFYDSANPMGLDLRSGQHPRQRVTKVFKVWKEPDPSICQISGKVHSPAIVNRCGGPTAEELNICGICGSDLTMVRGVWIAISDEQAYAIRTPWKEPDDVR